jgi:hypothetical protein
VKFYLDQTAVPGGVVGEAVAHGTGRHPPYDRDECMEKVTISVQS